MRLLFVLLFSAVPALSLGKFAKPCEIASTADDVFVGRILNISPTAENNVLVIMDPRPPVRIRFAVTERFPGLGLSTRETEILSSTNYSYFNHSFQVGRSYLIYARRNGSELSIGWR